MHPPAGRLALGDRVTVAGHAGRVVAERLTHSNGAWWYTVELDGGGTVEALDYEIKRTDA
jgi:hypothetical protein